MKKLLTIIFMMLLVTGSYANARTVYDSTGRHIVKDGTIRGQKREAKLEAEKQQKMQAAAAAKLNYEEALLLNILEEQKPKTNFYQDQVKR